jgi:hypothetical protein
MFSVPFYFLTEAGRKFTARSSEATDRVKSPRDWILTLRELFPEQ